MMEIVAETGSTSTDLAARLRAGERIAEGHWLVADRQTAGRGRLGREWTDGLGNFMGSTPVHLRAGDPPAPTLALVAGLALHGVLAGLLPGGHRAQLKWPNDVMVDGAKLAGILLERERDTVIIGIGVNLAAAPALPDRPTVALADLAVPPTRDTFAQTLADGLAGEIERWRSYGLGPVIARWKAAAHPVGTALAVIDEGGSISVEGQFAGLGEDGSLQLRLADGQLRAIHAGDVGYARKPQES
jgi:BirA family biotin operon repressor/biotin-[acetyl-CoA-carboxylase] ligase